MSVVRALHSLALAVWLGGMTVLGVVVAPSAFQVLQAREAAHGRVLAAAVFGTVLDRFQFLAYGCAAVVLVTLWLMRWLAPRTAGLLPRAALAAGLLAVALYTGYGVYPEVEQVQAQIGAGVSPSTLEATDPRRVRFDALHARSTRLMQLNLIGTVILLAWHTHSSASRSRS